jgi:Mn-dependent DtxR family transcriptional regulator
MAMKENSKNVLNYLKAHNGEDLTAADVADALGLAKRSVDGIFTAMQKKGLGVRTPAEVELDDGSHKAIKLLSLTDAGMSFDPDADAE